MLSKRGAAEQASLTVAAAFVRTAAPEELQHPYVPNVPILT